MGLPRSPTRHSGVRLLIVALSFYVLISGVADVRRLWNPIGVFGTIATGNGIVRVVAPGSPADRARIKPGDRFDIAALPAQQRWYLFPANCTHPGAVVNVGIIHGNTERHVRMVAVPEPMGPTEKPR